MNNEAIVRNLNDIHELLDRSLCIFETHMEALQVPHVRLNEAVFCLRDAARGVRLVRSAIEAKQTKQEKEESK